MNGFIRLSLLCGLISLAAVPVAVSARPGPAPRDDSEKAARRDDDRLTLQSLKGVLTAMSYDGVEELKNSNGKVYGYEVKRKDGGWTFYATFELSESQTQVWVSLQAPKIPDPAAIPSSVLLDMLSVNNEIWPNYFTYSHKTNRFYLYQPIPNKNLAPDVIRDKFETMCAHYKAHEGLWNYRKWPAAKPPAPPPPKGTRN